jgi:hypothetical protein
VLKAAVDLAQCSRGLNDNGSGRAFGFLGFRYYSARGSVEPVDDATSGFVRQHDAAAASRLDHSAEVTTFPVPLRLPAPLLGAGFIFSRSDFS